MSGGRTLRLGDEAQEQWPSCFAAVVPGAMDSTDAGQGTQPSLTGLHRRRGQAVLPDSRSGGGSWFPAELRSHAWEKESLEGVGWGCRRGWGRGRGPRGAQS